MLEGYAKRIEDRRGRRYSTSRLVERHFPSQFDNKAHKPNCTVCPIIPNKCSKKDKSHCKRKQTTFFSDDCPGKPSLCIIQYFRIYHTVKRYGQLYTCDNSEKNNN